MGGVESLLTQYSIESIILLILGIVVAFKFISELWDWCYVRIKKHFNIQSEKQLQDAKDREELKELRLQLKEFIKDSKKDDDRIEGILKKNYEELNKTIGSIIKQQKHTTERLQENTRSFIIDKHHYFCYKIKAIDDTNLQSLERRYMYYKADGGDSFIDQLMEEIRQLPKINIQHRIEEIEREELM